jgi:hypothetical protein
LEQLDTGKSLDMLKLKINQLKLELAQLDESNKPMPELINSTNLLRTNEILIQTNKKKTELLSAYESYFNELNSVIKKIQTELSHIKTQRKTSRKKQTIRRIKKSTRKTSKKTHSKKD